MTERLRLGTELRQAARRADGYQLATLLDRWSRSTLVERELRVEDIREAAHAYAVEVRRRALHPIRADRTLGHRGAVYFIRIVGRRLVKVGTSVDVLDRMTALQTSIPDALELLGVLPGGRAFEQTLHKCLAPVRARNEWFRLTRSVRLLLRLAERDPRRWGEPLEERNQLWSEQDVVNQRCDLGLILPPLEEDCA